MHYKDTLCVERHKRTEENNRCYGVLTVKQKKEDRHRSPLFLSKIYWN